MGGKVKWALILAMCLLALACNLAGLVETTAPTPTSGRIVETPQEVVNPTATQAVQPQPANPSPEADVEAQTLQPCTLVTADEASSLLKTEVQAPQVVNGTCAYNSQPDGIYLVSVTAAQGEQTEGILEALFLMAGLAGAQIDQAGLEHLQTLAQQQDFNAFFEELVAGTQGLPTMKTRLVEGVDDTGYWAWVDAEARSQAVLVMAQGVTLVNLSLVVDESQDEQAMLEASRAQIDMVFQRLPPRFVLPAPTETPTPSETPTPTPTLIPSATLAPSDTPFTIQSPQQPNYYQQASYSDDCRTRPANSVCLGFQDSFIWFIQPFNDSIQGWGWADAWQGNAVQVAYGQLADYYHVLNTNLVMIVAH